MNTTYSFGFTKDEADTGIPTLEIMAREPRPIPHAPHIKASPHSLVFTSESWTGYEWINGAVAQRLDAFTPETAFHVWTTHPTKSIFMFNEDPEKQTQSRTIRVSISSDATTPSRRNDPMFETTKIFLQVLADQYSMGKIDVSDIVRRLGKPWNESTVVLLLEALGAHRPIGVGNLSQQDQENVLRRLAQIRGTAEVEKFNNADWIQREVIASQRIESIYILPDDFATIA